MVNYIFPSNTIRKRVHRFSGVYHATRQDFARMLPNFQSPVSKNFLYHYSLVSYPTPNILDPIQGEHHKMLVWPLTSTSKFSNPFSEDLTKRSSSHWPIPQNSRPLSIKHLYVCYLKYCHITGFVMTNWETCMLLLFCVFPSFFPLMLHRPLI